MLAKFLRTSHLLPLVSFLVSVSVTYCTGRQGFIVHSKVNRDNSYSDLLYIIFNHFSDIKQMKRYNPRTIKKIGKT